VFRNRGLRKIFGLCEKTIGKNFTGSSCFVLSTEYYYGDENKEYEMGGACGTHEGNEKCVQGCGGEDHLEGLGVGEGVIFERIFKE
jgi:hypothetical protein